MYTLQPRFKSLLLKGEGGGKIRSRGACVNSKEEKLLRLLFQLRPRIRHQMTGAGEGGTSV
jgi:hypothetical protein